MRGAADGSASGSTSWNSPRVSPRPEAAPRAGDVGSTIRWNVSPSVTPEIRGSPRREVMRAASWEVILRALRALAVRGVACGMAHPPGGVFLVDGRLTPVGSGYGALILQHAHGAV